MKQEPLSMADLFARLSEQVAGTADVVQPLRAAFFAPLRDVDLPAPTAIHAVQPVESAVELFWPDLTLTPLIPPDSSHVERPTPTLHWLAMTAAAGADDGSNLLSPSVAPFELTFSAIEQDREIAGLSETEGASTRPPSQQIESGADAVVTASAVAASAGSVHRSSERTARQDSGSQPVVGVDEVIAGQVSFPGAPAPPRPTPNVKPDIMHPAAAPEQEVAPAPEKGSSAASSASPRRPQPPTAAPASTSSTAEPDLSSGPPTLSPFTGGESRPAPAPLAATIGMPPIGATKPAVELLEVAQPAIAPRQDADTLPARSSEPLERGRLEIGDRGLGDTLPARSGEPLERPKSGEQPDAGMSDAAGQGMSPSAAQSTRRGDRRATAVAGRSASDVDPATILFGPSGEIHPGARQAGSEPILASGASHELHRAVNSSSPPTSALSEQSDVDAGEVQPRTGTPSSAGVSDLAPTPPIDGQMQAQHPILAPSSVTTRKAPAQPMDAEVRPATPSLRLPNTETARPPGEQMQTAVPAPQPAEPGMMAARLPREKMQTVAPTPQPAEPGMMAARSSKEQMETTTQTTQSAKPNPASAHTGMEPTRSTPRIAITDSPAPARAVHSGRPLSLQTQEGESAVLPLASARPAHDHTDEPTTPPTEASQQRGVLSPAAGVSPVQLRRSTQEASALDAQHAMVQGERASTPGEIVRAHTQQASSAISAANVQHGSTAGAADAEGAFRRRDAREKEGDARGQILSAPTETRAGSPPAHQQVVQPRQMRMTGSASAALLIAAGVEPTPGNALTAVATTSGVYASGGSANESKLPDSSSMNGSTGLRPRFVPPVVRPEVAAPRPLRSAALPLLPTVRVTIGRVEVCYATTPTPATPPASQRSRRSSISLDEMLKRDLWEAS
jgi:hypothetical protein